MELINDKWIINRKEVPMPPDTTREGRGAQMRRWEGVLSKVHSAYCPWRCRISPAADLETIRDEELAQGAEARLEGMRRGLVKRPVLDEDVEDDACPSLRTLACAGWELAPNAGVGSEDSRHRDAEYLRCVWCLRCVAVQSFTHRPVSSQEAEEAAAVAEDDVMEPPRKVRRRELPELDAARGATQPPSPAFFTPVPRGSETTFFDPHECHRYYCPMYGRKDDDISRLAIRTSMALRKAREEAAAVAAAAAAAAAQRSEAATVQSVETAVRSAAAAAEDILRKIEAVLPPEGTTTVIEPVPSAVALPSADAAGSASTAATAATPA